ncbi:protocatechuate 3,4-dioxygenase subunit alpha [Actinopolymorpha sp. B9G3]|uniref:protocatechuate 3,4-dioxygenase subunit alpha n=1 Tax=Actinopolymorpha sp. B9G3 TaxID=3158970 RepID=UPI0032D90845
MTSDAGSLTRWGITPSQTVGPYLSLGLPWSDGSYVVPAGTPDAVRIGGQVVDGAGVPVPDALVETWQADPAGRFDHPDDPRGACPPTVPGFRGFGRSPTDTDGRWWVLTVKPGCLPCPDGDLEAPHLTVSVLGRGMLDRLVTRIYFPDEQEANAADPVLAALPAAARATLVAQKDEDGLRFDIRLQGANETCFFAV